MQKLQLLLIMGIMSLFQAHSQNPDPGYLLHFKTGPVVPETNAKEFLSTYRPGTTAVFQSRFFKIVQFYTLPGLTEKTILRNAGVELLDYLPDMAYFTAFRDDFNPLVLGDMNIRSIMEIRPEDKLALSLFEENYPAYALEDGGNIKLIVSIYPNLDLTLAENSLRESDVQVTGLDDQGKYLHIVAPISAIRDLAARPFVMYVEPGFPEPDPENYTGRTLHHTNVIASDYAAGRHYTGDGVEVMLQDDGVIGPHIDYQGRIGAQFLTSNSGNHGDHCAGIIFGAGNINPQAKGNAFGADLYVYSVSPNYPGFSAIPTVYNSLGIRVTSASYGDGCNSGYTSLTRMLDQQVRLYPSLLHVFSAGNSGATDCGYGAGAGWGNITGGHKMGKNVIAVANLDFQDGLASSSSRGPATDGRIKPDLGAKGTNVYSTINPNTYESKSGTSMACPGTAGTLAQLIQAYRDLNNGVDPPSGLLKAIMLNTAEDLGNPGPDFKFGWGRINARRAVEVIEELRFDSGSITQGASLTQTVQVPSNTAQLRVMVYWTDYEAAANASVALVNNLNITLTDPASTTWNPWVLSHFPHPDSLSKPAARGVDMRNNMEQVSLNNPAAGVYTLTIHGFNIPQGPQTFYTIYEFIPNEVILTYPMGGETLVPGETEVIRWDALSNGENFTIEVSTDNGQTWDTIDTGLNASSRTYNWVVPPAAASAALVKITRGSSASQSVAPFSILGAPCSLKIDWACDQALHLSWSPVMGAIGYEVMKLGEKYMEPAGITASCSFILEDPNSADALWLSVRALGADSVRGRRATAVTKAATTINCFPSDAMLLSAPSAEWGVFQNDLDLDEVSVPVVIKNFGTETITDPVVHFRLNNGTIVTETVSGVVEPDSVRQHLFAEKIDISATGEYVLMTWVDSQGDQNPGNDTLRVPFEVVEGSLIPTGSIQTFDTWTKCSAAPVCEVYACPLADGWLNLENNLHDKHDWRIYSGSTTSVGTGPDTDHTTGTTAGKYLYLEPSVACLNKSAILQLPCIDLTSIVNPSLKLWYHALGADIGTFHIDLFDGSGVFMDIIDPIEGSRGNEWNELIADLSPWTGKVVGIRFRGVTSCRDKGDFAIDDVSVNEVMTSMEDEKNGPAAGMSVYPNPTSGKVYVALRNDVSGQQLSLKVLDLLGRVVYRKSMRPEGNRILESIDLSDMPAGTYVLEVTTDITVHRTKLIIR